MTYPVGEDPRALAVGDFDGNGKPDLVSTSFAQDNVSVLMGTGSGAFEVAVQYSTIDAPELVVVTDVNTDGVQDLAIANLTSPFVLPYISILRGMGNGTFRPEISFGVQGQPASLASADINGDGTLDLAVGNLEGFLVSQVTAFLSVNGTLQQPVGHALPHTPRALAFGDFNGPRPAGIRHSQHHELQRPIRACLRRALPPAEQLDQPPDPVVALGP